ncbi:Inositol 2-dehydrogenase/D-chiro-inositol 3-dehydrogenase [Roseimaritima multifibrata]|uniref:Inositol 2-dehydrogenase/D-chiro-inositol 3-dehydrogenase n=1 Tax=Roseimaritima multifibrata TaxID=1930274 RepID=A0A517MBU2_9BACT|nr:Gfo/Idh/MocA family oxidoreductase [Roseimaritima multifibrata]QDS92356.1 Inositol 2-dehydrogenase/D-chiro-inositol 3-dehydrogenase [Roseimaritima multifibrata]
MRLRVGLIGLGDAWKTRYRPALKLLHDRFDVRAIYTNVPWLAAHAATDFQAQLADGYRSLIQRSDIDAVLILEPCWQGWLPMLAACDQGKAIYWAADLNFEAQQSREVKSKVDASGVAFMAEFPRRFAPATLRLKELIATRLGQPKLIFCHQRMPNAGDSKRTPAQRNGVPQAAANSDREILESIDWCRYVVGRDPVDVYAREHRSGERVDYRSLSMGFQATESAPAVTAQLSVGTYIPTQWHEAIHFRAPSAMQICCENGVAFIDLPSSLVWFDEAGRHLESLDSEMSVGEQLLTQFHRAVTSLVRKMGDLEDAWRASQVLHAGRLSLETQATIKLTLDGNECQLAPKL